MQKWRPVVKVHVTIHYVTESYVVYTVGQMGLK